jgi:uncharacterized protein Usg
VTRLEGNREESRSAALTLHCRSLTFDVKSSISEEHDHTERSGLERRRIRNSVGLEKSHRAFSLLSLFHRNISSFVQSGCMRVRQLVLAEFIHIRSRAAFARIPTHTHIPSMVLITYRKKQTRLIPNHTSMKQFFDFWNDLTSCHQEHSTRREIVSIVGEIFVFSMDTDTKATITRHENGVSFENRERKRIK